MVRLRMEKGAPPLAGATDLSEPLHRLRAEGTYLEAPALHEVHSCIEAAAACRRFFADGERAPLLSGLAGELFPLKELGRQIRESIGPRGEILDGASFELGDLRRQIRQVRDRIKRALEALLGSEQLSGAFQERLITERNGRYVVPVRADHRGAVKGFVHDESASGQTLYVEPASVLSGNNELLALLREEKREEERILRRLGAAVREASGELAANQVLLARLDRQAAVARFAAETGAHPPRLLDEPAVELRGARHPLLLFGSDGTRREGEAAPIDLLLPATEEALVISGPNTGGKTVALKTLGLLVLLVRAGVPVPCHPDSGLHLFGSVFADIGDEQSIAENLSTFSGHLTRVVRILERADGDSLVLLDEAGTGTDPAEGGALALAVLDALRERGARTVLTTHLNLLKGYAHLREGVANAAVEFDRETLAPTYRLHYGIPGASSAFTIARRLGVPEPVLEQAGRYLGAGEREGLELIEELNRLRITIADDLAEARRHREQADLDRNRRRKLLEEIEGRRGEILAKAVRRGEQVVREAEAKIRALLREARESAASPPREARLVGSLRAARAELAEARPDPPRTGKRPREVEVGEILRVAALGAEGRVLRVQGEEAELDLQGKKLRVPFAALEQFSPRRFASRQTGPGRVTARVERESFSPKLMLVGERVEEALDKLERFLDDALLQGVHRLEVVHGSGEGRLRKAVRERLAGHREVAAFHGAAPEHGGENVTEVELRE